MHAPPCLLALLGFSWLPSERFLSLAATNCRNIRKLRVRNLGTIEEGARNAVRTCMGLQSGERLLIVSDTSQLEVGLALKRIAEEYTPANSVKLVVLEEIAQRPLSHLPKLIEEEIARSNVTLWCATSLPGELTPRRRFINLAKRFARHGHMPNITPALMQSGMCADYDQVYDLTHKVFGIASKAATIRISNPMGVDVTAEFEKSWHWIPCDGRYHKKGNWGNLPEGETFTAPKNVHGKIVTNLLGDWFSEKYGNFKDSLEFEVRDSRIDLDTMKCGNRGLLLEVSRYLMTDENSDRASEFALPSNPLLISSPTIGNLLQDEKARPHIAFGDPYSDETGAPWSSTTHVDVLMENCDVFVDGKAIMRAGRYIF